MSATVVRYWGSYFKSLRHARRVAACFLRSRKEGWRCVLVCCRPPDDPSWMEPVTDLGVEVVWLPRARGNFDAACVSRAFRLCRAVRPDVFHCDNTHTSPLIGAWLARVPVRLWSKRSMEPAFEAGREPGLRDRVALSLRLSCWLATRTLPVSEMVAGELTRMGIPSARVQVLRSAVEPGDTALVPREQARTAMSCAPGEFLIVAVGRADPVKGWDVLVRACGMARERAPQLRLLLVGSVVAPPEQPFKAALDRTIHDLALQDAVQFTGHLPVVGDVLSAADLFVLPSRSEGHSLALVEALRSGLPCVASAVGGAPELIRPGENGLLFPRGDVAKLAEHIVTLAQDQPLRAKFSATARSGLNMPTPDEHADALHEIYVSLLRNTARSSLAAANAPSSR